MNYSEIILGKKINDLTLQNIEDFFEEGKDESNTIEFKSFVDNFGRSLEGVIRAICAFLNSDGGIIIWGAPNGQKVEGRLEEVFKWDLTPVSELKEKDQLISKISDSIIPLPVGIKVQIVEKDEGYIYIFEIEKSLYSPHQFKNTYLARLDGQTKPAPHYLVEALFKKISYPNLEGYIKLENISHDGSRYYLDIAIFIFNFSELQNEENVSYSLTCSNGIFAGSQNPRYQHMYTLGGHQLIHSGLINTLHFGSPDRNTEKIIINPADIRANSENKIILLLTFGGKKSPLKASNYKLDLTNINWAEPTKLNYLFEEIDENKLFSTQQAEIGTNKMDTLQSILER